MGRFLVQMFAALSLVVGGSLVAVAPVNAASSTSVVQSSEVVKTAPQFSITKVEPKTTTTIPKVFGGGGIKPVWLYVSCYTSMNGDRWCWRYSCTYFEYVALGCRDGWYRVSSTWRA